MTELIQNQVINVISGLPAVHGLVRVLWIDEASDRVITIALDQQRRQAPQVCSLEQLRDLMSKQEILPAQWTPNPLSLLTDDEIGKRFPSRNLEQPSYPLAYRAFWWSVIEPITLQAPAIFSGKYTLGSLIAQRADELKISRQRIYLILYRFWAQGSTKSALLPDTPKCGARGMSRAGKDVRFGRRNLAAQISQSENTNYPLLAQVDIDRIQFGWRTYVRVNVPIRDAYIKTLQLFYVKEWEQRGHQLLPNLKDSTERPSEKQFQYHGERQDPSERAYRKHLSDKEWALNHRALSGKKRVGLQRIGAVGQADAATNDVHLVSVFDRTKVVGPCSHLLIVDEFTGLIVGFYVGWSVDSEAVKLATLHAASSKVDFCARYGIFIEEDDFPKAVFGVLRVDRGEFNSEAVRQAFENIHSSLEYVATGRGDEKGLVEGKHHSLHASSGHKLPGTTYGQMKKRGERDPALDSCINIHEYVTDLIRAVIHHNTRAPVNEQLTTEMRQDGVMPTRIAIWQWAKRKGYVAYVDCSLDRLIANLCPQITAVVKADGIYLVHRRGHGVNDEIILHNLRYLGTFAERQGWLENVRRRGVFRIPVRYNPYDLQTIWYIDPDTGLQAFELITSDPLLGKVATMKDILLSHTWQKVDLGPYEERALQSLSDMAILRESTVSDAQEEQRADFNSLEKLPSKKKRLEKRKENRSTEVARSGKASLPPGSPNHPQTLHDRAAYQSHLLDLDTQDANQDFANQAIDEWLKSGGQ
jgi:putative transposase